MKSFIFAFALIACLLLAQGLPVDETTDGVVAAGFEIPVVVKANTGKQCGVTGDHCHLSDDCCNLRCASYHQRCVT